MPSAPKAASAWLLGWPVALYIRHHRDRLQPLGRPLSAPEKARMAGYFADVDLERVRLVEQDPLPIAGLPFQGALRACGFDFPDPRLVTAITFDGVIAARHPLSDAVLFHELVHVVQFRLLGVREFSRQYVDGFLKSGSYEGISLEICAYGLEARFDLAARPFAVEDEVRIKFADRERG